MSKISGFVCALAIALPSFTFAQELPAAAAGTGSGAGAGVGTAAGTGAAGTGAAGAGIGSGALFGGLTATKFVFAATVVGTLAAAGFNDSASSTTTAN